MEAQAKNLHFDLANSLNKTALFDLNPQAPAFVSSTKSQMADIYTKALMGALSVGILGRVGLGAVRSMSGPKDLNYGPDVGAQTLNIAAQESEDEDNFKTANARNWIASLIKHLPDVKVTPGEWDTAPSPNIDHLYKGLTPLPAVKPAAPALAKSAFIYDTYEIPQYMTEEESEVWKKKNLPNPWHSAATSGLISGGLVGLISGIRSGSVPIGLAGGALGLGTGALWGGLGGLADRRQISSMADESVGRQQEYMQDLTDSLQGEEKEKAAAYPALTKQASIGRTLGVAGTTGLGALLGGLAGTALGGQAGMATDKALNPTVSGRGRVDSLATLISAAGVGLGGAGLGGVGGYQLGQRLFGDENDGKNPREEKEEAKTAAAYPALTKKADGYAFPFNLVRDGFYNAEKNTGIFSGDNYLTTPRKGMLDGIADTFGLGQADLGAWGVPATYGAVPAALGALYGGYKLTDYILDKRRKANIEQELEDAQKSYDQAIAGQNKQAAAEIVDDMFDRMADVATTKSAHTVKQADAGQMLLGGYGLYGVLSALASGVPAYKFFENRSKREMISKALKQRQENKFGQGIRPIYAYSDDAVDKEDANPLSLEV